MKKIIVIALLIISVIISVNFYKQYKFKKFLKNINDDKFNITEYYIYGTHLNIKGQINENYTDSKIKLVLKSIDEEIEYNLKINNSTFTLSSKINDGINLEKLNNNKYYLLIKIGKEYYKLNNLTKHKKDTYYSFIKNNKCNKLEIEFDNYFTISSKKHNSNNIYDIVIDAGHGGTDSGATYNNYYEADLTYKYAKALKKKLTNLGYKVKLTRDKNEGIKTYGKHSRTAIPNEVHAKYLFSIHFNSSEDYITQSGVEIYTLDNTNLSLAHKLITNIVNNVNINYSTNTAYLVKKGIYIKNFRQSDISYMNEQAYANNYNPYNITTSTPYLYMIRETGGRITNAFVDGRNSKYEANPYYNSNVGVESYLLELGYINNQRDLQVILKEKNKYIDAISLAIDKHIKNNS